MTHTAPGHAVFHDPSPGWSWSGIAVIVALHLLVIVLLTAFDIVPMPPVVATLLVRPITPEAPPSPSLAPRPLPVERRPLSRPQPVPAAAPAVLATPAANGEPATVALPVKAPPPAPPPALPVSAPQFDAAYLNNPPPAYPPVSRRLREEGRVVLHVRVLPDGLPDEIEVQSTSGSPRLDQAARETVRRWRFVPARQGGDAIAAWVRVPIAFFMMASSRASTQGSAVRLFDRRQLSTRRVAQSSTALR